MGNCEVQNIHVKQQLNRRNECPDFVTIIFINMSIFTLCFIIVMFMLTNISTLLFLTNLYFIVYILFMLFVQRVIRYYKQHCVVNVPVDFVYLS